MVRELPTTYIQLCIHPDRRQSPAAVGYEASGRSGQPLRVRNMSAIDASTRPALETPEGWSLPYRGTVGMVSLIIGESSIFTIFVVAYLYYVGKSLTGPTPREVLEVPIFFTICLLSSSLTIHFAGRSLERDRRGAFLGLWFLTIVLGALFIYGTGHEWHRLIYEHGLTISTNLFGTTYYSLVGLHAFHVTAGLV